MQIMYRLFRGNEGICETYFPEVPQNNVLIFHIGEVALMNNRKTMLYSILLLGTTIKKTNDRLSSKKRVTSAGHHCSKTHTTKHDHLGD